MKINKMAKKTILLGLNEINFGFINYYISRGYLSNFKKLLDMQPPIKTVSESRYELLEPWIQWVTVHTGKRYDQHKIFRLGDIVNKPKISQIFEELENEGFSVGAVSPFNAENRLKNPDFFIPDPWTKTKPSGNYVLRSLYNAIHQSVNDNAEEKLNLKSIFSLALGLFLYVPISRWFFYLKNISNIKKPGFKAIILDSLLADVFLTLWNKNKPDFSNLFLNSGAHIQHHYLFNSEAYKGDNKNPEWYCPKYYDPLIKILNQYDVIIGKILNIKNLNLIVATGLHQEPHEKVTFYWRIKKHSEFLNKIGLKKIIEINPRMSRDFLINFSKTNHASEAEKLLNSFFFSKDKIKIFNVDNRGKSLFVELVYPNDINKNDSIYSKTSGFILDNFKSYLSFVAIKNGEHNGIGYLVSNFKLKKGETIKLEDLKSIIKDVVYSG